MISAKTSKFTCLFHIFGCQIWASRRFFKSLRNGTQVFAEKFSKLRGSLLKSASPRCSGMLTRGLPKVSARLQTKPRRSFPRESRQHMTLRRVSKSSLIGAELSAKTFPKVSEKFAKSFRKVSETFPNQQNKYLNSLWKCFPKSNETPKNQ